MQISGIGPSFAFTSAGGLALTEPSKKSDAVTAEFLKWAKMTPAERMRANILSSMGMTEEEVAALGPKERQAVEAEIKRRVEEQLVKNDKRPGQLVDVRA